MMQTLTTPVLKMIVGFVVCLVLGCGLFGCSMLLGDKAQALRYYSFDAALPSTPVTAIMPELTGNLANFAPNATIVVAPIHAAAGFDRNKILYIRQPYQLNYFRLSQWVDTPAMMLTPLVVSAFIQHGLNAVRQSTSSASGQFLIAIEILRLQQEFFTVPSRVHFTIRVQLLDYVTGHVIAIRDFDQSTAAQTEDTYGGVVAANSAVRTTLNALAIFCQDELLDWQQHPAIH